MITLCTVILDSVLDYYEIYKKSVATRTKLVSEVFIAKVDSSPYEKTWHQNGITFHEFGMMCAERSSQGIEHGLGLHACIDRAKNVTNDYIMFHDPDVFFYEPVDKFFYDVMTKHDLNYIGVSHCAAAKFAYTFFPYLSCALVNKKDLPSADWLKGHIRAGGKDSAYGISLDGKYLIRMDNIPECVNFPNPNGDFDTGSMLWLWAHQNSWKWLSFQTVDVHTYTTKFYRGSVKIKENFPMRRLLYHATSSTAGNPVTLKEFEEAWGKSSTDQ